MEMTLKRVLFTDDGAPGVLICGSRPLWVTLEENWRDNARGISCIPEGSYLCQLSEHPKHGMTYEVMAVPGRSSILIHSGNTEADTEGCILLGKEYGTVQAKDDQSGVIEEQLSVLRSKEAFTAFMDFTKGTPTFVLHVKNC
jgi:hypothetical protein